MKTFFQPFFLVFLVSLAANMVACQPAEDTHTPGPKNICIVTQYSENTRRFAERAVANQANYAIRQGYHAFSRAGRVSGDRFLDPSRGKSSNLLGGGLYWQKLAAMEDALGERDIHGGNLCEWVMWVDSDIVFTNFTMPLESVIATYAPSEAVDVILSREEAGCPTVHVNAGAFFVRNSEGGRKFIQDIGALYSDYKDVPLPEQSAMQDTVFQTSLDDPRRGDLDYLNPRIRSDIALAPQRVFNGFYRPGLEQVVESARWQPCDLLAHLAGVGHGLRADLMEELEAGIIQCEANP